MQVRSNCRRMVILSFFSYLEIDLEKLRLYKSTGVECSRLDQAKLLYHVLAKLATSRTP